MSKDDRITWHVTGETCHLYQDCRFVRRSRERPSSIDRSAAERMGFKICRLCAAREAREAEQRRCIVMDVDGEPVRVQVEPGRELSAKTKEALADLARAARAKARELSMDRINSVLGIPAGDANYAGGLQRLTDEELLYCWDHETRKGGLKQIMREIKRREKGAG